MPSARSTDPAVYSRPFWIASASHFLLGMGFWMFVLFPLHLAALGAGEAWIGVLLALEPLAAVLVRPALGGLLSRRGRRWVFRAGGALNLAGVALYLVVDDLGIVMALVRIVHGVGIGALFTTFFTYAADIAPVGRRTESLTVFGISGMLPAALAPLLGEALIRIGGFALLFGAAAAFSVASLWLSWRLEEPPEEIGEGIPAFWGLALGPRLPLVWLTTLVFSLGMSSYVAFLAPYAYGRGIERVGVFFFCYSLAAVMLRILGRAFPDRIGPRRVLVPALGALAVGLLLVSRAETVGALAAAGLFCGMGHGYLFPILSSLAIEGTDLRARGGAMSFFTAVFDLGQVVGPPVFGLIAETVGYAAMFLTAMAAVTATLLAWIPELLRGGGRS